jgi:hypothetical protein
MRSLFFVILTALSSLATAQSIEIPCEGSPKDAVLSVPQPADRFLHVLCSRFGHLLTATRGWLFTQPGAYAPVFFPAQMVRENPAETGHSVYFKSINVKSLTGPEATAKWSASALVDMFPKGAPQKALEVIAENNTGGTHSIYLFQRVGLPMQPYLSPQ